MPFLFKISESRSGLLHVEPEAFQSKIRLMSTDFKQHAVFPFPRRLSGSPEWTPRQQEVLCRAAIYQFVRETCGSMQGVVSLDDPQWDGELIPV